MDAAFSRLDLDGDGLISREEFDRESDRLFRQLDTNGDGVFAGTELSSLSSAVLGDLCTVTQERRSGLSVRDEQAEPADERGQGRTEGTMRSDTDSASPPRPQA